MRLSQAPASPFNSSRHLLSPSPSPPSTIAATIMSPSQPPPQEPAEQGANNPTNQAATAQQGGGADEETGGYAPLVDPRLPTRKDTSLKEFLAKIDDYAPIVSVCCQPVSSLYSLFLPPLSLSLAVK